MTGDQLALTPAIVSRILIFVFTLAIGLAVSYLVPSTSWEGRNAKAEVSNVSQTKRHCSH